MKNFKKIICIALCLVMSLQLAAFANTQTTVDYSQFNSAFKVLELLNITDGIHIQSRADSFVSRYELGVLVTRLLNVDVTQYQSSRVINDVTEEQYPYAAYLMDNGIILGDGNGNFIPDTDVTVNQVLVVMMRILGYDVVAKYKGGEENFYVEVASKLNIESGITRHLDDRIQLKYLLQIMFNALRTEMYVQTLFGTKIQFEAEEGRTLLYDRFNIMLTEGVINSTEASSFDGSVADANCVKINGVSYDVGDTDAKDYFGYYVEAYYQEPVAGVRNLVCINEFEYSDTTVYNADDLDFSDFTYYYEDEKGNETKYKLDSGFITIINGKFVTYAKENMIPVSGTITLVNTDNDSKIETVVILSERQEIVHSYNPTEEIIALKYGGGIIELADYDEEKILIYNTKNEVIEPSSIREWSVLTIFDNGEDITIYVSNDTVKGSVSEIYSNAGITYMTVGEQVYELSPLFKGSDAYLGAAGTFGIDINGKIALYREGTDMWHYGFLFGAEKESGLEPIYMLKIFDTQCTTDALILTVAKNIVVNGEKCTKAGINSDGVDVISQCLTTPQMVRYKSNAKGTVCEVQTEGNGFMLMDYESDTTNLMPNQFTKNHKWKGISFAHKYQTDANTLFFAAPYTSSNYIDYSNEKQFDVIDTSYMINNYDYAVIAYKEKPEDIAADVIVVKRSEALTTSSAGHAIVESVVNKFNEEGEIVECIKVFTNAGKTEYLYSDSADFFTQNGVDENDIIMYRADSGVIIGSAFKVIYDKEDGFTNDGKSYVKSDPSSSSGWTSVHSFTDAPIVDIQGGSISFDVGMYYNAVANADQAKIIIVDGYAGKSTYKLGTLKDIKDIANFGESSKVVVHIGDSYIKNIYVYNN